MSTRQSDSDTRSHHITCKMSHLKAGFKRTAIRADMVERVRNGRFMHQEWTETPRETDAAASSEWQGHITQCGDLDSEDSEVEDPEYSEVDYAVPELMAVPLTAPVVGESFCQCVLPEEPSPLAQQLGFNPVNECLCGEEDQDFDWVWDDCCLFPGLSLSSDNRKVSFHSDYSCGTAAIRGIKELGDGHHFWEIKMTSPVYGTDMMVGIGTSEVNLEKFMHSFCSMLGHDEASWGLSYSGLLHHKGETVKFSSRFGQGSIIGLHLDTWNNTLTFYKNRCRLGMVATRLPNKKFYPMVCSTAAKSSMKVTRARYAPTSLQYLCCARLRRQLPDCPDILGALNVPPGLSNVLRARLGWVFTLRDDSEHSEQPRDSSEELMHEEMSPGPISRPVSPRSAWASPSPCTSPVPNPVPFQCPCALSPEAQACVCRRTPSPSSSDYESCCSEPEDYQHKKCRWT